MKSPAPACGMSSSWACVFAFMRATLKLATRSVGLGIAREAAAAAVAGDKNRLHLHLHLHLHIYLHFHLLPLRSSHRLTRLSSFCSSITSNSNSVNNISNEDSSSLSSSSSSSSEDMKPRGVPSSSSLRHGKRPHLYGWTFGAVSCWERSKYVPLISFMLSFFGNASKETAFNLFKFISTIFQLIF